MHSDSKLSSNEYKLVHLLAAVAPSEAISSPPTHPCFLVRAAASKLSVTLVRKGCVGKTCYLNALITLSCFELNRANVLYNFGTTRKPCIP